ncbi:hypothetical protein GGR51DRAFT_522349 [Nemania sp. FL0031]|nr:hypothetical protein GGR51DRAFT_522349 [Nemania sp. FL0031]
MLSFLNYTVPLNVYRAHIATLLFNLDISNKCSTLSSNMNDARTTCVKAWTDVLVRCREVLGEKEYTTVTEFKSVDQLIEAIQQIEVRCRSAGIAGLLHRIKLPLSQLSTFVNMLLMSLAPANIGTTMIIWGIVNLLIHLASESENALGDITTILSDLGHPLALFEIYSNDLKLEPSLLQALFDVLVDFTLCSVTTIDHFRKNDIYSATANLPWNIIRGDFTAIIQETSSKINHLKEVVEAQNAKGLSQNQSSLLEQLGEVKLIKLNHQPEVQLPCLALPSMQNPLFHARQEVLEELRGNLNHSGQGRSLRTAALWGLGGVGKSQIALEFAHQHAAAGCQIILWIACETESEIASSFNKAANQLQVPGLLPSNTPDQNQHLVLRFLQTTHIQWLLIFDNVEDQDILARSRPVAGDGAILVTCRSESTAASTCARTTEISPFTTEEGSELLLKVVGQPCTPTPRDKECAMQLTQRLGGLALALDLTGKQIRARKKTIEAFLATYDEQRRQLNKQPRRGIRSPYYSKDLNTVLETSFLSLSQNAANLLSLICFVSPDDIPDFLFTKGKNLPSQYRFLTDTEEWEDAKIELLDLSLININPQTSFMSIHRLTRDAYFDRINEEQKSAAYAAVLSLLHEPFSRKAGSHLYTRWDTCSKLIQHVHALGDRYLQLGETKFYPPEELMTIVFNDAAWYLVETGFFQGSKRLTEVASKNCVNKESLEYADLLDTISTIYGRQSHVLKAQEAWSKMLEITLRLSLPNDERLPRAYNATVNGLVGMWKAKDAIEYGNKAVEYGPREVNERLQSNPDRWLRCRACAYYYINDLENAKKDLKEAEYWQDLKHGKNSHYHGEAAFISTKVAIKAGELDEAYTFSERAFELLSLGKPKHVFVAATRYQQGYIKLLQGSYTEALTRFREALIISQFNELSNGVQSYTGTSARCKWRMSQVLDLQSSKTEAQLLREEAENTKKELYDTGLFVRREGDESWDTLVPLLFR